VWFLKSFINCDFSIGACPDALCHPVSNFYFQYTGLELNGLFRSDEKCKTELRKKTEIGHIYGNTKTSKNCRIRRHKNDYHVTVTQHNIIRLKTHKHTQNSCKKTNADKILGPVNSCLCISTWLKSVYFLRLTVFRMRFFGWVFSAEESNISYNKN